MFYRLYFIIPQRSRDHFNLLTLLSNNFNELQQSTRLRFPEDDADALKHVGVLMIN